MSQSCVHVLHPRLEGVGGRVPRDAVVGGAPGPRVTHTAGPIVKLTPDVVLVRLKPLDLLPQLGNLRVQGLLLIRQLNLEKQVERDGNNNKTISAKLLDRLFIGLTYYLLHFYILVILEIVVIVYHFVTLL